MSKRKNLYKAMEEISDEHLEETARIKMNQQELEDEGAYTGSLWRRILGGTLAAACVMAVLFAATWQIWNRHGGTGSGFAGGSEADIAADQDLDRTKNPSEPEGNDGTAGDRDTASQECIIWADEEAKNMECTALDGVYLRFENGAVMLLADSGEPIVLDNWATISGQVHFENFDRIRIYIRPDTGIMETYPAQTLIAGVREDKSGTAQAEEFENVLKELENMGYILERIAY